MKVLSKGLVVFLSIISIFWSVGLVKALTTTIDLTDADSFVILAGSTVVNTGSSVVNGDLGLTPGSSVIGFPPGVLNGTEHVDDSIAVQAQNSLTTAYNDALGRTPATTIATELGGTTKTTGIYSADSFEITGDLTLDAQGDPDAVFIFKSSSTLTTAHASRIVLINDAQSCNVFWQVSSSATLGTNSFFKGNILALESITLTTGANVRGRLLARNAAVTLDSNTVSRAICATPEVPTPPLISIQNIPTPLTLPFGGGNVTYNYTVSNLGEVPISDIVVTDDKCSPVSYVSGDTNSNEILDITETWAYSCESELTQTTTNISTVTGNANDLTATDIASATVIVGEDTTPPLIHLVKIPSVFVLPSPGTVTYTYIVTNPGVVALSNVNVSDDKCSPISGPVSDANDNNLLDVSETWIYTCQTELTETTVNTATAYGSANNLTATDVATATVVLATSTSAPELPKTNGETKQKGIEWNIIIVSLACVSSISILLQTTKKRIKFSSKSTR